MTTSGQSSALVEEIEAAILATPGVVRLHRTGSLVSNAVDRTAVALGLRDEGAPLVSVTTTAEGVRVEAALGIRAEIRTAQTLRLVQESIRAALDDAHARCAGITLTVAHLRE